MAAEFLLQQIQLFFILNKILTKYSQQKYHYDVRNALKANAAIFEI